MLFVKLLNIFMEKPSIMTPSFLHHVWKSVGYDAKKKSGLL